MINKDARVLGRQKAEMRFLPLDVGEQGDAVEAEAGDVEFQRDAEEGGHGVVEEDFGGEGEGEGAGVGYAEDDLGVSRGRGFVRR